MSDDLMALRNVALLAFGVVTTYVLWRRTRRASAASAVEDGSLKHP